MSENELQELTRLVPLLIPLVIIELGLMIVALWDLIKRQQTRGPKWLWVLVIVLVNFIGPIIYLVIGRQDES
ncbi:MAG: PLD nuclease N-terminal domain-containing protein [Candidatus Promineifilaceae bacterium]|jgi:hypothetical protein